MSHFTCQVSTALFNSPFSGPSLQYNVGTDANNKNYVKLKDALNSADIERKKMAEEAEERERANQRKREERLAKIKYMQDMPDSKPAGTGKCNVN